MATKKTTPTKPFKVAPNAPKIKLSAAPTDQSAAVSKTSTQPATTVAGNLIPTDISGINISQVEAQLKKENAAIYAFWMQPDLKPIFEKAVTDGTIASLQMGSNAAAQKFSAALQPWLQVHGSSILAAESDKATAPEKYNETLTNRQAYIKNIATQMGYNTLTSDEINSIASLSFNTDYLDTSFQTQSGQDRLKTLISNSAAAAKMQLTGGTGATTKADLIAYNNQMGNPYSSAWIDSAVSDIVDPSKGVDSNTYKTMIKTASASKYSGFADQINKGVTVQQIADPYISKMTDLLELPYNTSNFSQYINDPLIQKGMAQSVNSDGTTQPMTNYNFANMVRQDPRWALTNNARDSLNGILHQVGKDLGVAN